MGFIAIYSGFNIIIVSMINYLIVFVLILFSALFSGLTLGLMGLNAAELKRKVSLGNKDAEKVYKVRKEGNLLLTTLLIGNVAINSTLSIFLGSITSGFAAGLIATSLIVIFGEITPQAVFSRFALSLGAKTAWLVKVFIFILYPISRPIAWTLNKILGEELPTIYSKKELMKIIEEHEDAHNSDVDEEEERIIKGALSFSDKTVRDVMTPRQIIKSIESSEEINHELLERLIDSGHSRFPVYKGNLDNIVGILYLRQLVGDSAIGRKVEDIASKKVFFIKENKKLDEAFHAFINTHHHLFIVHDESSAVSGIITLENVLEEIISSEIIDEADLYRNLKQVTELT